VNTDDDQYDDDEYGMEPREQLWVNHRLNLVDELALLYIEAKAEGDKKLAKSVLSELLPLVYATKKSVEVRDVRVPIPSEVDAALAALLGDAAGAAFAAGSSEAAGAAPVEGEDKARELH